MFEKDHITWHSHIKNLGLENSKLIDKYYDGIVGQLDGRKACNILKEKIKKNFFFDRIILFSGPLGSGKTALALGLAKEIGKNIPFYMISGSELFTLKSKKLQFLMESIRKSIGIRIFEKSEFYEGQVVDIIAERNDYGNHFDFESVIVGLKTNESGIRVKLFDSLCKKFFKSKIKIGDIIKIDPIYSRIEKSGTFDKNNSLKQFDEREKNIPFPVGKVFKKKRQIKEITFSDLDFINFEKFSFGDQNTPKKIELLQKELNLLVEIFLHKKKAEIVPGILFIDEAHFLDLGDLYFLSKTIESKFSPLIILATNRSKLISIKSFNYYDQTFSFMSKCLSIKINVLSRFDITKILAFKSRERRNYLTGKTLIEFYKFSEFLSIRYGFLILNFANFLMKIMKKKVTNTKILNFCNYLFLCTSDSFLVSNMGDLDLKINLSF
ncbi:ruvb-like 1 [Baffinella frigidus]|nr:ruvb-like 1 [Cryptophyta sp. CCMP2293]